jgi:hypothetical protein
MPARAEGDEQTALLRQGVELRLAHRDAEALAVFARAVAMDPTPVALAQVGLAEQALGHWVEAEKDVKSALEHTSELWIAKNRLWLEAALAETQRHLAWLKVEAGVSSARIQLDGRMLPYGIETRVPSGAGTLTVSADAHVPEVHRIDLAPAEHAYMTLILIPSPAAPETAASPVPVPAPTQTVSSPPSPTTAGGRALPWLPPALMGVGAAGIAAGAFFGVKALLAKQQRDDLCKGTMTCPSSARQPDEDGRTFGDWSTAGFAVGAALGAAGGLWWALEASHDHRTQAALPVGARFGRGSSTLILEGTFP